MAVEDVVAQDQCTGLSGDELLADDEGLGEAVGHGLDGVGEFNSPILAIAEQTAEHLLLVGRGDDEDVADPRQHQRGERVVDHRFVVNRQKLLADPAGDGPKAGARAPGQDDAFRYHGWIMTTHDRRPGFRLPDLRPE